jgi:hypothetical protein
MQTQFFKQRGCDFGAFLTPGVAGVYPYLTLTGSFQPYHFLFWNLHSVQILNMLADQVFKNQDLRFKIPKDVSPTLTGVLAQTRWFWEA